MLEQKAVKRVCVCGGGGGGGVSRGIIVEGRENEGGYNGGDIAREIGGK